MTLTTLLPSKDHWFNKQLQGVSHTGNKHRFAVCCWLTFGPYHGNTTPIRTNSTPQNCW